VLALQNKPTILILGTFHMRYTPDIYRKDMKDILEQRRQQEIEEVVSCLVKYQPTKIAVEIVAEKDEILNQEYQSYREGKLVLAVDEVHQFGFRVASHMKHEKLYAIDWMESVGNRALSEVYEWAKENQSDLYNYINENYRQNRIEESNLTILRMLQEVNNGISQKRTHEMYMLIAKIGTINNYVGIDWLRWWYQRNLILYSNLTRLAISKEERILFIVGMSHVHLVNQFLEESGDFEVENANKYLCV
jgi:hypothetical protein